MKLSRFHLKSICTLLGAFLVFSYFSLVFGKSNHGLTFKIICEPGVGAPCTNDSAKSAKNYIMLNGSDIQCVSEVTTIDKEKNITIYPPRKSMNDVVTKDIFKENLTGEPAEEGKLIKNPDYNKKSYSILFKLTPSAAKKLNQLSSNNVGHVMQITYNNKVMSTGVIQDALSSDFQLAGITENTFKRLKQELNLKVCSASN